jgi:hypothetical protein
VDEATMIRDTPSWPQWPWLPVNHADDPDGGLVHCDDVTDGGPVRVYRATPETGAKLTAGYLIAADDLDVLTEYPTVEDLLAAGWTGYEVR